MKGILKTSMWVLLIVLGSLMLIETVRLLMLKRDITNYKKYWLAQAQKPAELDSLLYIALGDSAAQGIGASQPEKGYVGLIAKRINEQTHKPVQIINLSVSGAKVQDVIDAQLPQLKKLGINDKTVVTLDIGANDMPGFDTATFKTQMGGLLKQLPNQAVVADIAYFGGGRKRGLEQRVISANETIAELTHQYGLRQARLHEITKANDSLWTMSADLFHPSNRGYKNWYEAFRQMLDL